MQGILLLDKPAGPSSNQALVRLKRLLGVAKAGHTGTLDPLATGMLPCCLGEATKVAGWIIGARKAYRALVRFGAATTTGDAEGTIVAEGRPPARDRAALAAALARLTGRIRQRAPVHSAIKRDGVPLYRRARRGEPVEAPEREVLIERIEPGRWDRDELELTVVCGPGTYIRSLAVDLGAALGSPAHLGALRRLWVAPFEGAPMHGFETVEAALSAGPSAIAALLLPMEQALGALPRLCLDDHAAARLRAGQVLAAPAGAVRGPVRVADRRGFLGIGEVRGDGSLVARRLLAMPSGSA